MQKKLNYNPIMVAMDVAQMESFETNLERLAPYVGTFKIGLEAMTQFGAQSLVDKIHAAGSSVFLDGKFCDIPNTVGKASQVVADMGVAFFNVHASCGFQSIEAAAKVKGESKLLVVTVLTSMSEQDCTQVFSGRTQDKVTQFAQMAVDAGADGVVCSPLELELLKAQAGLKDLIKVTPGIRPESSQKDDQKRTLTPQQAMQQGADYLVIGRPILNAQDPAQAAQDVLDSLE